MIRRIAHLDMDAFFASVELLSYPELGGLPVVVGGRHAVPTVQQDGTKLFSRLKAYVGRGVVTTSTYEARALGVFSGMGLMKSAKLAPEAILLPANFTEYREKSRQFKDAVAAIAPEIENRGIDEIFIDLSDINEESLPLATRIKLAVFEATGLSCSIGIAPNKLLAKVCSDLEKPNGITIIGMNDLQTRIWPLPTKRINGIGPKAFQKLTTAGINTVGDLAETPKEILLEMFGASTGEWLKRVSLGIDERPLVLTSEPKSISSERTFERDLHAKIDKTQLTEVFTSICNRVSDDLKRKGYACKTVGIKLRYANFKTVTRDLTLNEPITELSQIRKAAGECLKRVSLESRIRLLGVRASGLVPLDQLASEPRLLQGDLFAGN